MQEKFQEFAKFYGMAVLGYAGQDLSIMGILDRIPTQDERYFENGIFWGYGGVAAGIARSGPRGVLPGTFPSFSM